MLRSLDSREAGSAAPLERAVDGTSEKRVEAFFDYLYELDVPSDELRRDRNGRSWLSPVWREAVEHDPRLREALATFVDEELELFESVRVRADFVFTTNVVAATRGQSVFGVGLDPRYRTWVIASAYSLAFGVAYVLWMQLVRGAW